MVNVLIFYLVISKKRHILFLICTSLNITEVQHISCIYYCCFFCEFVFLSFDNLGVFIIFLYGFIDSLYYGYYYLPGCVCYWYFLPSVACLLILSAISFVKQNIWIFMLQSVRVFLSTLGFNKNLCSMRREI